jgi:hypothetical protein
LFVFTFIDSCYLRQEATLAVIGRTLASISLSTCLSKVTRESIMNLHPVPFLGAKDGGLLPSFDEDVFAISPSTPFEDSVNDPLTPDGMQCCRPRTQPQYSRITQSLGGHIHLYAIS